LILHPEIGILHPISVALDAVGPLFGLGRGRKFGSLGHLVFLGLGGAAAVAMRTDRRRMRIGKLSEEEGLWRTTW
jgi:hypothetical protein